MVSLDLFAVFWWHQLPHQCLIKVSLSCIHLNWAPSTRLHSVPRDAIELLHDATRLLQPTQWERHLYTDVLSESTRWERHDAWNLLGERHDASNLLVEHSERLHARHMTLQTFSVSLLSDSSTSHDACKPTQSAFWTTRARHMTQSYLLSELSERLSQQLKSTLKQIANQSQLISLEKEINTSKALLIVIYTYIHTYIFTFIHIYVFTSARFILGPCLWALISI